MVHATASETPAAWRVAPRASKWLTGGSADLGVYPPGDLVQDGTVLGVALEVLPESSRLAGTNPSLTTKEETQGQLLPLFSPCEGPGVTKESVGTCRVVPLTSRPAGHHPGRPTVLEFNCRTQKPLY